MRPGGLAVDNGRPASKALGAASDNRENYGPVGAADHGSQSVGQPADLNDAAKAKAAPQQGVWLAGTFDTDAFDGGILDPAPVGTHFVVTFMTRDQRMRSMRVIRKGRPVGLPVSESNLPEIEEDLSDRGRVSWN